MASSFNSLLIDGELLASNSHGWRNIGGWDRRGNGGVGCCAGLSGAGGDWPGWGRRYSKYFMIESWTEECDKEIVGNSHCDTMDITDIAQLELPRPHMSCLLSLSSLPHSCLLVLSSVILYIYTSPHISRLSFHFLPLPRDRSGRDLLKQNENLFSVEIWSLIKLVAHEAGPGWQMGISRWCQDTEDVLWQV